MFFSFHMDYSDGEVALPECHIVKRKDMKLFCFFLDVFIAGLRSATVVPNHGNWRSSSWPCPAGSGFFHRHLVNWSPFVRWHELPCMLLVNELKSPAHLSGKVGT